MNASSPPDESGKNRAVVAGALLNGGDTSTPPLPAPFIPMPILAALEVLNAVLLGKTAAVELEGNVVLVGLELAMLGNG